MCSLSQPRLELGRSSQSAIRSNPMEQKHSPIGIGAGTSPYTPLPLLPALSTGTTISFELVKP